MNDIAGLVKPTCAEGYRLYSATRLCAVITNLMQDFDSKMAKCFDSEVMRILEVISMGAYGLIEYELYTSCVFTKTTATFL